MPPPNVIKAVADQIQQGFRPAQLCHNLQLSPEVAWAHLASAVLEGHIRWSDVLLTYPEPYRHLYDSNLATMSRRSAIELMLLAHHHAGMEVEPPFTREESALYWDLLHRRVLSMDCFDLMTDLERTMHSRIRSCLQQKFRGNENAWWRDGVPQPVRKACVQRREEDEECDDDPYTYTTLIDLKVIVGEHWDLFAKRLPSPSAKDKKKLLSDFGRLNRIRNRIMHPLRSDNGLSDEDYRFVREFHHKLAVTPWR